ncbi:tyrosine--tRNA ligase [Niabella drilacis]|uniref:Tyrosine--tRNA ligase n=1 Tax=Niabella drilacis (strain DSM 25811 / CCM 8410 / CCUG 62505 / LMG 26954 / E90) TaxID=1285928 RepID=A0A1G6U5G0_NIADE|nr:tyrosine--tRNA ligase [Niabella drilacis]SDD36444.1 tyrosyl-tRNA synthetase [Niabella drilacis]
MNIISELRWRGMIQDIIPGTEAQLEKEMTTGYIGFDPTATSLHIGSLVPILLLVHLQKAGHRPVALVGGATGMIGDPSGKSEERNLLNETTLAANVAGIKQQLERYLDFSPANPNAAIMVNNYDWFKGISFLEFLRDAGKHITVNYMMAKDSVKKRFEGEVGISYTEFAYQLMQGFDFYHLYTTQNVKLQMGGSDQWGNITTGTEFIRRKAGKEAFAFTCPLIRKADGTKFGKTEKGNVWLDPEKTSPYQFYQFWLNTSDEDAASWIKIFTFLEEPVINDLISRHGQNPAERLLQKTLAREITCFVHGAQEYEKAVITTEKLFANQSKPASEMSIEDLEGLEGVIKATIPGAALEQGIDIISLLADTGVASSKGEARKLIQGGGISLNREKVNDIQLPVTRTHLLHNRYILLQKGKKNYYLAEAIGMEI